ncbi:MAG: ferritin family protein [Candidatus Cloacimonetes bacterium]|nr:ferritin family protein [Candidatus Cloacimonadota bacterium]
MNEFSLNEVIEMAVQIERNGFAFYDHALHRQDLDKESRKLLEILRDDEISHEKIFKKLRDDFDIKNLLDTGDWAMVSGYLKAIADSHIFIDPQAAINLATTARNYREIILHAIDFEKDTLLYFYSVQKYVQEARARKAVERIIEEEAGHIMRLKEFLSDHK